MKHRLDHLVRTATGRGRAVGAFTCYDLATAHGVVSAAAEVGEGVVLLVSPSTAARPYGLDLIRGLRAVADAAPVPACVELDHAGDLGLVERAVDAGADAVLVDGSKLGYEENVRLILDARERLAGREVVFEAELGRISGNEDVAALIESGSSELTDPDQATDFVRRTGVDLLAVSVGNVHGTYRGEPVIDHDRLSALAAAVDVPLVLHGASGLPATTLRRCIGQGVGKINVNTELRRAVLERLAISVPAALDEGLNLEAVLADWSDTVSTQVRAMVTTFAA